MENLGNNLDKFNSRSDESDNIKDSKKEKDKKKKKKLARTPLPVEKSIIKEKKDKKFAKSKEKSLSKPIESPEKIKQKPSKEKSQVDTSREGSADLRGKDDDPNNLESRSSEEAKQTKRQESAKLGQDKESVDQKADDKRISDGEEAKSMSQLSTRRGEKTEATDDSDEELEAEKQTGFLGELIIDHSNDNPGIAEGLDQDIIPETPESIATTTLSELNNPEIVQAQADVGREQHTVLTPIIDGLIRNLDNETTIGIGQNVVEPSSVGTIRPSLNEMQTTNSESDYNQGWVDRLDVGQASNVNRVNQSSRSLEASPAKTVERTVERGSFYGWLFPGRSFNSNDRRNMRNILNRQDRLSDTINRKTFENTRLERNHALLERTKQELEKLSVKKDSLISRLRNDSSAETRTPIGAKTEVSSEEGNKTKSTLEKSQGAERQKAEGKKPNKIENIVELSAWHRIEKDKKTGKLVEKPSLEYGREFARERSQERLANDSVKAYSAVHLGSVAYAGAGSSANGLSAQGSDTMLTNNKNTYVGSKTWESINNQLSRNTTNPIIWLLAMILVFVLYRLGLFS